MDLDRRQVLQRQPQIAEQHIQRRHASGRSFSIVVVAEGTPEDVAEIEGSHTAVYLAPLLGGVAQPKRAPARKRKAKAA